MAEPKRRLVMDVLAPTPIPEPPAPKKKIDWGKLKKLRKVLPARKKTLAVCTVVVVVVIAGTTVFIVRRNTSSLPAKLTGLADFPIYYPHSLPQGWSLDTGSITKQGGIVYFPLRSAQAKIEVSEQAEPANPPNLSSLTRPQQLQVPTGVSGGASVTLPPNFHSVNTPAGQAVQGTGPSNLPIAMVLTHTTLINLSGTTGASSAAMTTIIQTLRH